MTMPGPSPSDVGALTVGVLGGTAGQGRGLAYRLASQGQRVLIGSRTAERARLAADRLSAEPGVVNGVHGDENGRVADRADIVVVSVPWEAHASVLAGLRGPLAGKIVIDCVNPLAFDVHGAYALAVAEGSAAQQAASLLPESRVCAAFHHVSASLLNDATLAEVPLDVLVLGDDPQAVAVVQALANRIPGMRGVHAGALRDAGQVEAFTTNLIAVRRRYDVHPGLRLTGL